jgi:hypothetical protein
VKIRGEGDRVDKNRLGRWNNAWGPSHLLLLLSPPRFWHSQLVSYCVPSGRFSGCSGFGIGLLRSGPLPGGGHIRFQRHLRDLLRRGIWFWVWSGIDFNDTSHSDDEIPPLDQNHLLGRGPDQLTSEGGSGPVTALLRECTGSCFSRAAYIFPLNLYATGSKWLK